MMKVISNNSTVTNTISTYACTYPRNHGEETWNNSCLLRNLSSIIKTFRAWEAVIIEGDFNAKTKSKFNNYPESIIDIYAKCDINFNGENIIEFCILHNLKITDTFFKHKPIYLTTWQLPAPYVNEIDLKMNTQRKNPYQNQTDYILMRNNTNTHIFDAKASVSTTLKSDHKPVIAKIMIKWNL